MSNEMLKEEHIINCLESILPESLVDEVKRALIHTAIASHQHPFLIAQEHEGIDIDENATMLVVNNDSLTDTMLRNMVKYDVLDVIETVIKGVYELEFNNTKFLSLTMKDSSLHTKPDKSIESPDDIVYDSNVNEEMAIEILTRNHNRLMLTDEVRLTYATNFLKHYGVSLGAVTFTEMILTMFARSDDPAFAAVSMMDTFSSKLGTSACVFMFEHPELGHVYYDKAQHEFTYMSCFCTIAYFVPTVFKGADKEALGEIHIPDEVLKLSVEHELIRVEDFDHYLQLNGKSYDDFEFIGED